MNPYLEGSMAPVLEELTAFDLPVTGVIPKELEGRWLRNGPNPRSVSDPSIHHWFLGDGMIHGVRLHSGRAEWYRNRWVRGTRLATELGEDPPAESAFGGRDFGPNTSVIGFAGRTLALVEGGTTPMALSYELETIGYENFGGTLLAGFTAHPRYDPATKELHAICYAYPEFSDRVIYVVVDLGGKVVKSVQVPLGGMPMIHDMSLTSRYVLIYDLPVCVNPQVAAAGNPFPFIWDPNHASRVGLLPRFGTVEEIVWCDVPQCYFFHTVNAYDMDNGNVVVDFCRYDKMFDIDRNGPIGDGRANLARWVINPDTRKVTETILADRHHEFPMHDPRFATEKNRYAYTTDGLELGFTHRVDLESGEIISHNHGVGKFGAEPLFVPKDGSVNEGIGWVFVCVNDTDGGLAELVILDGEDLEDEPVARIHLPQRVPDGFHGSWVSDGLVAPL